jgi:hypothetical protein
MAAHREKSWPSVGSFKGRPWGDSHNRRQPPRPGLSGGSISRRQAKRMLGLGAECPGQGPTVAVEHQEGDALYAGVVGEVTLIVGIQQRRSSVACTVGACGCGRCLP